MPELMDGQPKHPLDDMYYLDGYLSAVHDDDEMPDGAWFEAQKGLIAEHWDLDIDDAHEIFMSYLEWKERDNERRINAAEAEHSDDTRDQGDPEVEGS